MSYLEIASKIALLEPTLSELPYAIPSHSRLLYIYRTSAERTSALLRSALTSIEQGEAVVPFADERFLSLLSDTAEATGAAAAHHVCPMGDLDPSRGAGPDHLLTLVREALDSAFSSGFSRVRVVVDTQLAYTLAGTEEEFLQFASSMNSLATSTDISLVQICFYEFLPRHALADFLSMQSDVILSPALGRLMDDDDSTDSPLGLVSAIRALYLSKAAILRRVLDPVMTGDDEADSFSLPKVTDYFHEEFLLLDGDLMVKFASKDGSRRTELRPVAEVVSPSDYPRIREAIDSMERGGAGGPVQLTLAGNGNAESQVLRIHRLGFEGELVGYLCVFQWVASDVPSTSNSQRKTGAENQVTEREHEIIQLLLSGMRNREIADLLNVAEITVKKHLGSIYRKLHVRNRVELIRLWEHE